MAKKISYSTALRTSLMTAVRDAIDAGSGAGTLKLYTGIRPGTGVALGAHTLLATLTFADPCGAVTAGVLTFSAIVSDTSADADGTASWARIADSAGNFVADVNVGTSDADIVLNTTNIVAGGEIAISAASITDGNA